MDFFIHLFICFVYFISYLRGIDVNLGVACNIKLYLEKELFRKYVEKLRPNN